MKINKNVLSAVICVSSLIYSISTNAMTESNKGFPDRGEARWYNAYVTGGGMFDGEELMNMKNSFNLMTVIVKNGDCWFDIEFWSGEDLMKTNNVDLNGRIKNGLCNGKKIDKGMAYLWAERVGAGKKFKLSSTVKVIVPDEHFW